MSEGKGSSELLHVIAETLGMHIEAFVVPRDKGGTAFDDAAPNRDQSMVLNHLIKAFRALPDDASRLRVLRYVEALAAEPIRAD